MSNVKEDVYDIRIHPLVEKIAELCKEHDIALIIAADCGSDDFDRPIVASTVLLFEGSHPAFWKVKQVLFDGYRIVAPPIDEDVSSEEDII